MRSGYVRYVPVTSADIPHIPDRSDRGKVRGSFFPGCVRWVRCVRCVRRKGVCIYFVLEAPDFS